MNKPLIHIIKNPRITEKATLLSEGNVYSFDVSADATKNAIKEAVFEIYKVKPRKVNIASVPSKKVFSRGIRGEKSGGKKALVYLKKGDKIEIV